MDKDLVSNPRFLELFEREVPLKVLEIHAPKKLRPLFRALEETFRLQLLASLRSIRYLGLLDEKRYEKLAKLAKFRIYHYPGSIISIHRVLDDNLKKSRFYIPTKDLLPSLLVLKLVPSSKKFEITRVRLRLAFLAYAQALALAQASENPGPRDWKEWITKKAMAISEALQQLRESRHDALEKLGAYLLELEILGKDKDPELQVLLSMLRIYTNPNVLEERIRRHKSIITCLSSARCEELPRLLSRLEVEFTAQELLLLHLEFPEAIHYIEGVLSKANLLKEFIGDYGKSTDKETVQALKGSMLESYRLYVRFLEQLRRHLAAQPLHERVNKFLDKLANLAPKLRVELKIYSAGGFSKKLVDLDIERLLIIELARFFRRQNLSYAQLLSREKRLSVKNLWRRALLSRVLVLELA